MVRAMYRDQAAAVPPLQLRRISPIELHEYISADESLFDHMRVQLHPWYCV